MLKRFLLPVIACAVIILGLYWIKHREKSPLEFTWPTPSPTSPVTTPKPGFETPPPPPSPTRTPAPTPTPKPSKKYDYEPTITPGWQPPPTREFEATDFDETGSPTPFTTGPTFEPSPTGFPGWSTTSTEEAWQASKTIIIHSQSPREDFDRAKEVVQELGHRIAFQTERPDYQLKVFVPYNLWEEFMTALAAQGWDYDIEPSPDVGLLAPDQSVEALFIIRREGES